MFSTDQMMTMIAELNKLAEFWREMCEGETLTSVVRENYVCECGDVCGYEDGCINEECLTDEE